MSDGCADAAKHRRQIVKIGNRLTNFMGNFCEADAWLQAHNPFFKNRKPVDEINGFGAYEVLCYIENHMDPKVRARCLRYRSAR